jgi:hypothetical protein
MFSIDNCTRFELYSSETNETTIEWRDAEDRVVRVVYDDGFEYQSIEEWEYQPLHVWHRITETYIDGSTVTLKCNGKTVDYTEQ